MEHSIILLATEIKSFGFRNGLKVGDVFFPPIASNKYPPYQTVGGVLVCDVRRILPKNPYHNKKLRALRGDDEAVIAELESTPGIHKAYHEMREVVRRFEGPVYVACTGGRHRSVYIANRLGKDLNLPVEHLNYGDR